VHILLNWVLQGVIVAAAAAAGLRLLRGAPAVTRHAASWAALLAILSLPLVPSLWAVALTAGRETTVAIALELPTPGAGSSAPLMRLPVMFSATSALLGAAWMLWTLLQLVRVVRDLRWLRRARRRCRALPAAIAMRFSPASARLVAAAGARVLLCDAVRAAAVLGGGQPVIGLQRRVVNALNDRELNAVLLHELAHVMRRDSLATVVQRAVHVLVGWHPGVWWVMRRLALEREMACDEAALTEAGGPKAYATCLTRIAGLAQRAMVSPDLAPGVMPASGLRQRVVHVLTAGRFSRRTAGWASGTLCTSLCALATTMGTVVVFGEPAVTESVATIEIVTERLVQPLQQVSPAPSAPTTHAATAGPRRVARPAPAAVPPAARATEVVGRPVGVPVARAHNQVGAGVATQEPAPPVEPIAATAAVVLPAAQVATPDVPRDRPITHAAVAAGAGATNAWNATAEAAAETGVAVGQKTQKGAVATAGAFARWGRRIASSF
jgi:beta-lactamase regulating signal transducer with metallopeptidase domain